MAHRLHAVDQYLPRRPELVLPLLVRVVAVLLVRLLDLRRHALEAPVDVQPARAVVPRELRLLEVDVRPRLVVVRRHPRDARRARFVRQLLAGRRVEVAGAELELVAHRVQRPVVHPPVVDDAVGVRLDARGRPADVLVVPVGEEARGDEPDGLLQRLRAVADRQQRREARLLVAGVRGRPRVQEVPLAVDGPEGVGLPRGGVHPPALVEVPHLRHHVGNELERRGPRRVARLGAGGAEDRGAEHLTVKYGCIEKRGNLKLK